MSDLEICQLVCDGKVDAAKNKINEDNDLAVKQDKVIYFLSQISFFAVANRRFKENVEEQQHDLATCALPVSCLDLTTDL